MLLVKVTTGDMEMRDALILLGEFFSFAFFMGMIFLYFVAFAA